ncbi:hypothetical protein [Cyanothece sp. BG0011]|nr:hypothetical protein [Cyanothece sp. BG0011]
MDFNDRSVIVLKFNDETSDFVIAPFHHKINPIVNNAINPYLGD